MGWRVDSTVRLVLGIIGNISAVSLYASPMPTFWRILKLRDTEDFGPLPYICTLLNCSLFAFYGLPFVTKDGIPIVTVGLMGMLLQIAFLSIFITFAPHSNKLRSVAQLTAVTVTFAAIAVTAVVAFDGKRRKNFVGSCLAAVATIMYASPLAVMRQVLRTKSVEFMPFYLSLTSFTTTVIWFIYGIYVTDIFIFLPNGLGVGLSSAQLVLYACFWKSTPKKGSTARKWGRSQSQIPFDINKADLTVGGTAVNRDILRNPENITADTL